jgi:hypothetical protein
MLAFLPTRRKTFVQDETEGNIVARLNKNGESRLEFFNQVAHTDTQRLGNSHQGKNTGRFFSPFQFANINRMQVGFFRQFFLAQFGAFAVATNRFADDFLMLHRFRHISQAIRKRAKSTQCIALYLFYCTISIEGVKVRGRFREVAGNGLTGKV